MKRTIVYIDGFNLYYRLKEARTKWLDVSKLCSTLLPQSDIRTIRYFTARVNGTPGDAHKLQRQLTYFRALRTIPYLTIHEGHFLSHEADMPLANPQPGQMRTVRVIRTEEKGSDVNLATCMLCDGFADDYDVAVIVSNDSDQVPPIDVVRKRLKKQVVVLNPNPAEPSAELKRHANLVRDIRAGVLKSCQFPPQIQDPNGTITMPAVWDSHVWCEACRLTCASEQWIQARRTCPSCRGRVAVAWSVVRLAHADYPELPDPGRVYPR